MAFDAENLKYMAARAVTEYLNQGKSLNKGVADIAVEHKLNQDQIARLVETTNKVAYVKVMETATDRAGSFPLASVTEVNELVVYPGNVEATLQKSASAGTRSPLSIVADLRSTPLEKQASEVETGPSVADVEANLHKVASYFRKSFESLAMDKENTLHALTKVAYELNADKLAGAKILATSDFPEELCKVAQVEILQNPLSRPFYAAELEKVAQLDALWATAKDLVIREAALEAQLEKFASYGTTFLKACKPLTKSAQLDAQKTKPLIGGLVGYLGRGKTLGEKAVGVFRAADTLGQAALIDKNPSVWQSLRG